MIIKCGALEDPRFEKVIAKLRAWCILDVTIVSKKSNDEFTDFWNLLFSGTSC